MELQESARGGAGLASLARGARSVRSRLKTSLEVLRTPHDDRRVAFMIIGAQKGGTTWMSLMLNDLPGFARSVPKETRYFHADWDAHREGLPTRAVRSHYLQTFWPPSSPEDLLFEASPGYLAHAPSADRIRRFVPEAKFVVVLRDPTMRAFSNYNMWVRNRGVDASFRALYEPLIAEAHQAFERHDDRRKAYESISRRRRQHLLSHGMYALQLEMWFARFPRDQFFVMTNRQTGDREVLGDLMEFVGADRGLIAQADLSRELPKRHRGDAIDPADRAALDAFYAPHNERLFELLGVDGLDW